MNIHWTKYVSRQTPGSGFSHFDGSKEEIIQMVKDNFHTGTRGFRDGVHIVNIDPRGWLSPVVTLTQDTILKAEYKVRFEGEEPRKVIMAKGGKKIPAKSIYVALFSSHVLAETGENELPAEDGNWEIITMNASPWEGKEPMNPEVLMHNHFGSSGGTDTKMNDEEFVAALRVSHAYWKDKCMLEPVKEGE